MWRCAKRCRCAPIDAAMQGRPSAFAEDPVREVLYSRMSPIWVGGWFDMALGGWSTLAQWGGWVVGRH